VVVGCICRPMHYELIDSDEQIAGVICFGILKKCRIERTKYTSHFVKLPIAPHPLLHAPV